MAYDLITADVFNNTGFFLVVKEDEGDFRWLPPGESSSPRIRSVDAVGVVAFGVWQDVVYRGRVSSFWHIRDGTSCGISFNPSGSPIFTLEVYRYVPYYGPLPSKPGDFGYRGVVRPF